MATTKILNRLAAKYATRTPRELVEQTAMINQIADDIESEDYRDRHLSLLEAEQERRVAAAAATQTDYSGRTLQELAAELDLVERTIATFSEITLSDRIQAWAQFNRDLVAELESRGYVVSPIEAHEAAHRENEVRWAAAEVVRVGLGLFNDETEAIADLAVSYRRMWRLAREVGPHTPAGRRHVDQASLAHRELMREYGFTIEGGYDVLTLVAV